MNKYFLPILCLIGTWIACVANAQEINKNGWDPDTTKLDYLAKYGDSTLGDAPSSLAHDVKRFYGLLRDKKWHETYELRAKAFREDFVEPQYMAQAKRFEKIWGLANYEILSVGFENSLPGTNVDEAILICRFTELPGYVKQYSTVYWHREDGVWKCMSAGPLNMPICRGTRPPIMDWR